MSKADSMSVFAEGTFEEQVQELVNYLTRGLPDDARTAFIRPYQEALITPQGKTPLSEDLGRKQKTIQLVLSAVKGLGEGNDREIEGFFNLLYAHITTLFTEPASLKEQVAPIIHVIVSSEDHSSLKYKILSNLFNALPRNSPLRLQVYNALIRLAVTQDDVEVLQISDSAVDRWLSEWDISDDEKSEFLLSISDAYEQGGNLESSYSFYLTYVRSLAPSSPKTQDATLQAISTALKTPVTLDFDSVLKLPAIPDVKDHPLFALLKIFVSGTLVDYKAWVASNAATLEQFKLPSDALERKIRLLTLASLGTQKIGTDLSYAEIASALQIEENQVEAWVIDVIRAGLLSGKLSQPSQTLHVTRASHRSFKAEDWKELEKRLVGWKAELVGVLEVIAGAKAKHAATKNKSIEIQANSNTSDLGKAAV